MDAVEFSQAPHDIQDDLIAIKQLKSLEDEKNNLVMELSNMERGIKRKKDEQGENDLAKASQNKQFNQPLFPSSQVRKYRSYGLQFSEHIQEEALQNILAIAFLVQLFDYNFVDS
ncbi:BFH_collapsed_G0021090.mRNA.1.CDS.1 [Saccharomyces cerevisiae]|nr:BFH_collapsed_G0021090.mRNA.1.CDS.1 [Saccharomyces cerevisiae]